MLPFLFQIAYLKTFYFTNSVLEIGGWLPVSRNKMTFEFMNFVLCAPNITFSGHSTFEIWCCQTWEYAIGEMLPV